TSTRGEIAHLVIDSTGLKVFGEGEWKVRKHGKERRRIWRKLHQQRCPAGVQMEQFRPNLVVSGVAAWEEDSWKVLRIGDVIFDV
ncbi:MOSC domain-containing protein, partial [Salmonella enterica subsp. enterica serovar Kentucky]|nr:MOSC domain-containing protein [Salmonella enterica subsp. enterica serovar Kentucky]